MPQKPKILATQVVASSELFCIETVDLRFSNGEERRFERLAGGYNGAVLVVPLLNDDTVLLIKEYCVGMEDYEYYLPKGKVDAGEAMLAAANRELKEEVGYGARQLHELVAISQAPAYMRHRTHLVIARDLYEEKLQGDEPEPLEVLPLPLAELENWVMNGKITEARSIAALYLTRAWLDKQR
ncbi:MAG: ADP compounds hydrolase NudE [Cellvibrionaceae bacterium]|nr:ADP compounds hydrolase NudE [Cellvibrionaceae bacterium]